MADAGAISGTRGVAAQGPAPKLSGTRGAAAQGPAPNDSWVETANSSETGFSLANLPYGVFAAPDGPHIGVAIGDQVLDLNGLARAGVLPAACLAPNLNALMALPGAALAQLRQWLTLQLGVGAPERRTLEPFLRPMDGLPMLLPVAIGDYTDFYASIDHATNVGSLFRPDNPLLPNYKHIPIGYHGRSSSIVASGHAVRRPQGQIPKPGGDGSPPSFGPSRQLDYEMELGVFIGEGNALGVAVPLAEAERHLFGVCLLNDWSARDIQRWEYQPLGPFLGKSFATSISPWVVTMAALEPYRVAASVVEGRLAYLEDAGDRARGGLDVLVEVWLVTRTMREQGIDPVRLSQANVRDLYWTLGQMVAHHTSNGCNLRTGDLLGTGTISGPSSGARGVRVRALSQPGPAAALGPAPTLENRGCMLELTWRGQEPLVLPNGEKRTFLEDGDQVTLRGFAQRAGLPRISLGECRGEIAPAAIEL